MCKIIEFPNRRLEIESTQRKERILRNIEIILDNSDCEIAVVFKTKDVQHMFENKINKNFLVGLSDIETMKSASKDYFFSGFHSKRYFDLDKLFGE